MSKNARAKRRCSRKVSHATRDDAIIAMRKLKRARSSETPAAAYLCPSCGGWHWGNSAPRTGRPRRKVKRS